MQSYPLKYAAFFYIREREFEFPLEWVKFRFIVLFYTDLSELGKRILGKRILGLSLSSDDFLAMSRKDKELEDYSSRINEMVERSTISLCALS